MAIAEKKVMQPMTIDIPYTDALDIESKSPDLALDDVFIFILFIHFFIDSFY